MQHRRAVFLLGLAFATLSGCGDDPGEPHGDGGASSSTAATGGGGGQGGGGTVVSSSATTGTGGAGGVGGAGGAGGSTPIDPVVECPGPPLQTPASGTCEVTSEGTAGLLLRGTVLAPDQT